MAGLPDDNLYQIPYLQGNDTFYDWVNYHNTLHVNKLNKLKIYDGLSGDGIVFTLGTTASNDPQGGATAGSDLIAGSFRCDIAETIARGVTFQGDVSINGTLNYDINSLELPSVTSRVHPVGGYTASRDGFTLGQAVRVEDFGHQNAGGTGTPNYYLARADNAPFAEVFGIVSGVTWPMSSGVPSPPYTSANTYIEVTTHGKVVGDFSQATTYGAGLSAGCIYFLDAGTSGGITPHEPSVAGYVSKPLIMGITADTGYVLNYRGQLLTGSGTGGTGGIDNNRFMVAHGEAAGIFERGHVVGYKSGRGTAGWFVAKQEDDDLNHAVGLVLDEFILDSTRYMTVVTTGWCGDLPTVNVETGLLYVNRNGKLENEFDADGTPNTIGNPKKPFAVGWSSNGDGTGNVKGAIINQNHLAGEAAVNNLGAPRSAGDTTQGPYGIGNWAFKSTSVGGTTYGSAINENILINGGFDVWQRGIGTSSYGATGTTYFADRWVRIDGASGSAAWNASGATTGTFNIQRKAFSTNQTEVFGNPTYYTQFQNDFHPQGDAVGSHAIIENRIEDVRTLRNENATLSFWAKSGVAGSTGSIVLNQYDGSDTYTHRPSNFTLGTSWAKYEVAFYVPNIETTPSGKHYLGVGFDTTHMNTTFDLAQVKLERGIVATRNASTPQQREDDLHNCSRYYQRSYGLDQATISSTMLGSVPDVTAVNFTVSPSRDNHYTFPVVMRADPTITLYSPFSGQTSDGYNQSAGVDLRHTAGTYGWSSDGSNTTPRNAPAGTTTITSEYATKNGIYLFVPAGTVIFDEVSVHYVADADLTDNMNNT